MISAIVLAGGMGTRMGGTISKQFLELNHKPLLYYSIKAFDLHPKIDEIVVVIRESEEELFRSEILKYSFKKPIVLAYGGAERKDSVENGLKSLSSESQYVLIHDGARPFLDANIIDRNIEGCIKYGACVTGVPSKDTIKIVNSNMEVVETPPRASLYSAQTPQSFKTELIKRAFKEVKLESKLITDDSMMVEQIGVKVKLVEGSYENIKLTTPEDMIIGEEIARRRGI